MSQSYKEQVEALGFRFGSDALLHQITRIAASADAALSEALTRERRQAARCKELEEALKELMAWQVKNVNAWNNSAYDNAHRVLARPAAPLSEVKRQRLKRGSTGVCSRSICVCERDGLGDECVWLSPVTLRSTPSNERG